MNPAKPINGIIGLSDLQSCPFFRRIAHAISEYCARIGADLLCVRLHGENLNLLRNNAEVLGVIAASPACVIPGKPHVLISSAINTPAGWASVTNDDPAIGRLAARHLALAGVKKLLAVEWFPQHLSGRRLSGFSREAARLGIPCRVARPERDLSQLDFLQYRLHCESFFSEVFATLTPDTGLFAVNDERVKTLLQYASSLNLRAPDDFLALGVDDLGRDGDSGCVQISSVEPDTDAIAAQAVEALLEWQTCGRPPAPRTLPPRGVVRRGSCYRADLLSPAQQAMMRIRSGDWLSDTAEMHAEAVGVSRITLHRRFREEYQCTPHDAILQARMQRARELLRDPQNRVERVAVLCGYTHASTFIHRFKEAHGGIPPGIWRTQSLPED